MGGLGVGLVVVAAVVAVAVLSGDGSDAVGPDTVSEYTSILDALDAIDGPAILETDAAEQFGEESVLVGSPETFQLRTAVLYDARGGSSRFLLAATADGDKAGTQMLFDGVTLHRIEDGTYQTQDLDEQGVIAYGGVSLEKTRALLNEAASALRAAELAGALTRVPSVRQSLDELRVAAGAIDSAALLNGEPIPGMAPLQTDSSLRSVLISCAGILVGTGDDSFHYAFIVNSGNYSLVGGRCWVEQGGELRDVYSIYQSWTVHPADNWEALVAEIAPELAAVVFE